MVTPHLAAASTEQIGRGVRFAMDNALRLQRGRQLLSIVSPDEPQIDESLRESVAVGENHGNRPTPKL